MDSAGLNSKQYFVAGLFYPDVKLKYPDEYSQEEFKKMVVNHVRIDKVPTPFISTFITPLSPIHRAFKNREGAIVTIIDPAKLQTPFFFAKAFVFNLEIRQGKYCGVGEYLIWGKVPSQAIVASFKISDLERIAADHGDIEDMLGIGEIQRQEKCDERLRRALSKGPGRLDSNSGFIVGKLLNLLGIPQSHGELVAEKIVSSWRLRRTGSWENFKSGLNSAFAASFGLPSPLPSSQSNMSGVLGGDEVHGDEVDVDVVDVDELDADWSSGDYVMVHNESEEHF